MSYNHILFTSLVALTLIGCADNGVSESKIKLIKAELEQVKAKYINLEKEYSNEIELFQTKLTQIEKEYADLDNECSGLIPLDTELRDNNSQLMRCHHDSKKNVQTLSERV